MRRITYIIETGERETHWVSCQTDKKQTARIERARVRRLYGVCIIRAIRTREVS